LVLQHLHTLERIGTKQTAVAHPSGVMQLSDGGQCESKTEPALDAHVFGFEMPSSLVDYPPKDYLSLIQRLGTRILTADFDTLFEYASEIASKAGSNPKCVREYMELILSSRNIIDDDHQLDQQLVIAASNAISTLNYGHQCGLLYFQFCHFQDWSHIRAPYANLNMSNLGGCRFDYADLSHASFYLADLRHASFKGANLDCATNYESIPLSSDERITDVTMAPDSHTFAFISANSSIYLCHIESNKKFQLAAPSTKLSYSLNSAYLASGGPDGTVNLWSVADGVSITTFQVGDVDFDARSVTALAFSTSDGYLLAVGSSRGEVEIWRFCQRDGSLVAVRINSLAVNSRESVEHLALSSCNMLLAAVTSRKTLHIWDVSNRTAHLKVSITTDHPIETLTYSSDGLYLAAFIGGARHLSGSTFQVLVWESLTGDCVATIGQPLVFEIGGQRVKYASTPSGCRATPLGAGSGETIPCLNAVCREFNICISQLLPSLVWELHHECVPHWINPVGSIAAVSPDGRRLIQTSGGDRYLRVCDTLSFAWGSALHRHVIEGGTLPSDGPVPGFAVSPDGRIIASIESEEISLWDAFEGKVLSSTGFRNALLQSIRARGHQRLEEAYEPILRQGYRSFMHFAQSLWFCMDYLLNHLTLAEIDGAVRGECGCFDCFSQLSFSPDGTKLLITHEEDVYAVEVPSGKLLQKFYHFLTSSTRARTLGDYKYARFLPDGRNIIVHGFQGQGSESQVTICDYETREQVYRDCCGRGGIGHDLTPDGGTMVQVKTRRAKTAGPVWISVIRLSSPTRVVAKAKSARPTMVHYDTRDSLIITRLSPRGSQVAFASTYEGLRCHVVGLWDVPTRKRIKRKRLRCKRLFHHESVAYFSWLACGLFFLTASNDGLIYIWNARTGACLRKINHGGGFTFSGWELTTGICISSSTSFRPILVTFGNGVTRVWRIDLTKLKRDQTADACNTVEKIENQNGLITLVRAIGRNQSTCFSDCNFESANVSCAWRI